MKIISLNVSLPKIVEFRGSKVSTGIYNEPVEGRLKVRTLNIEGDEQADLTTMGALIVKIDLEGGKLEDVVAQWLKENEATWQKWTQ